MVESEQDHTWHVQRLPTGVPNLDRLIDGGLTRGGLALVVGGPGTGKTVLTEQMAFNWASQGQNVLWLVTLGEPDEKFLTHLSEMRFYDRRLIGAGIQLVNLTRYLRRGFHEKLEAIRDTIRSGTYACVVIDGFQSFRAFLQGEAELRLFLSELGSELALMGITLIVTADLSPQRYWEAPEFTMADAIIWLEQSTRDGHEHRQLSVLKLRGRPYIGGTHTFSIHSAGVHVHPRLESVLPRGDPPSTAARQLSGLPRLDDMLGGGYLEGSATLVAGSVGTGKTLLAGHFLSAGVRQGQPCLYLSFFEGLSRLLQQSDAFGLSLAQAYEAGLLQVRNHQAGHCEPDICGEKIAEAVEERGIRRLVIDGLDPLERLLAPSGRTMEYMAALTGYLRLRGVTALYTYELPEILASPAGLPTPGLNPVVGNLIVLRQAEMEGRLRRFLSIVKTRYGHHSNAVAELLIQDGAMDVLPQPHDSHRRYDAATYYGEPPRLHEGERLRP